MSAGPTPPSVSTAPSPTSRDVLVIGGGPAGSTIATLLARRGYRVRRRREGSPPAVPHRRVAAAAQPAALRAARRARESRVDRDDQARRGVLLRRARPVAHLRLQRAARPRVAVRLPGAAVRVRPHAAAPLRRARGRSARGHSRHRRRFRAGRRRRRDRGRRRRDGAHPRPVPRRRVGARHVPRRQARAEAAERKALERRALRPLHRRRAARRPRGRQHQHLLVPARLDVVHPAEGRHDERRRGLLALLPQDAQGRPHRVLPRDARALARARRAAARREAHRPGDRDRQLLLLRRPDGRRPLHPRRRRLRLHRPGVLERRVPRDEQRVPRRRRRRGRPPRPGRRAAALPALRPPGPARVCAPSRG